MDPIGSALTHILVVSDIRVADCRATCELLRGRGGEFLTPPHASDGEVRCFLRDPDGHLLEISEARSG
jgi:catechol 2,3-dioxygenase-like lactoylglutathione lyase family enzyme